MKRNKNFLEFIPEVNDKIEFYEKDDLVYLVKKHNHILIRLLKRCSSHQKNPISSLKVTEVMFSG